MSRLPSGLVDCQNSPLNVLRTVSREFESSQRVELGEIVSMGFPRSIHWFNCLPVVALVVNLGQRADGVGF